MKLSKILEHDLNYSFFLSRRWVPRKVWMVVKPVVRRRKKKIEGAEGGASGNVEDKTLLESPPEEGDVSLLLQQEIAQTQDSDTSQKQIQVQDTRPRHTRDWEQCRSRSGAEDNNIYTFIPSRSPSRSPRSTLLDPRSTPLDPHGLVSAVRPRSDGRHFPAPAPNSVTQDALNTVIHANFHGGDGIMRAPNQETPATPGPSSTEGPEHQVSPVTTYTEIPPLVPPPGAAVLTAEILEYVEGKFREAEASPNHRFSMKFDVEIQGNDLLTLKVISENPEVMGYENQEVSDNVITFFLNMVSERNRLHRRRPKIHAFDVHFYDIVTRGDRVAKNNTMQLDRLITHPMIKDFTSQCEEFMSMDMLLIPIHNPVRRHWTLGLVNLERKPYEVTFTYYDSIRSNSDEDEQRLMTLAHIVKLELEYRMGVKINTDQWVIRVENNIPQQQNAVDCGVFVCQYADFIGRRSRKWNFSQENMNYFRKRMAYEILTQRLLT
ncbi:unnamed protein product [Cyprideis torosa]|uniref:Uncharacterized protein n=1 Tax=Cyprideis torosa TaxID=163714 RepID=A0A7R8WHG5_9CRUS|nr:unnamed protein product [Cyprideis torosa]CAG0893284.1 unnamed protein product [Cyprideis torosa]